MKAICVFEKNLEFNELELYKLFKEENLEVKTYLSLDKQYLVVTGDVKTKKDLRSFLFYRTNSFVYDLKNNKYLDVPSTDGITCDKLEPKHLELISVIDRELNEELFFYHPDFRSQTRYD